MPGLKPMTVAELFFGGNVGSRLGISNAEFNRFVAGEITSRFPDGLTVLDAHGQWRDPQRMTLAREASKVVVIAFSEGSADDGRLQKIVDAYKDRFNQKSVGILVRTACGSFD
ncbi:MAG: DUF3574 domain-containing protein [Pseudomonadota bacterium]